MDLAGLRVVMDADFSAVYAAFNQANGMMQDFANNVKNAFNSIPDFKGKFNFTSNGASQAAQDAREYARAARDQAAADLDALKAKKLLEDQQRRNEQATKKEKDAYGQLVADSNALVRAYQNAAAAIIKDGDAAGITAAKLEEMRQAALKGQDQIKEIDAGVGRFQRNVGNYASAVSGYFGQTLARSAHAAAEAMIGMQRGVNALAVDLPNLIQEFRDMVAEQNALKAAGKESLSITQLLAQAFNPLTLAIQFGVIALVKYGPELYRMATGAEEAKKKAEALKKAQDELNEAFDSGVKEVAGNINQVQALSTAIKDANLPMQTRIDKYNQLIALYPELFTQINKELGAHDKLNTTYPALFDNLDNHKGKINALDLAIQQLNTDLYKQAIAQGFAKQVEKLAENGAVLIGQQDKLQDAANSTAAAYEKALAPYKELIQLAKDNPTNERLQNQVTRLFQGELGNLAKKAEESKIALDANTKGIEENKKAGLAAIDKQKEYSEQFANSTTSVTNYREAIQHEIDAAQKQVDTTKAGTQAHKEALAALSVAQKKLDAYSVSTAKSAKVTRSLTTALADLTAKNKEIDAELQIGSTTLQQALQSKISNYQAYILQITKTSKYKIPLDDSRVVEAQKQLGILSQQLAQITHQNKIGDIFKGLNASISDINDNELDGSITKLETVKQEYAAALRAKRAFSKEGIKSVADVAMFELLSESVKKYSDAVSSTELQEGQRKFNESLNLINQELSAGLITGSEALGSRINLIKQHLRDLVKAGQQASQEFKDAMSELNQTVGQQLFVDIQTQLQQLAVQTAEAIGEGLGQGFAAGSKAHIQDFLAPLETVIAQAVKSFGAQLIKYGIMMKTANTALKAFYVNPNLAIIAGIGLEALASYALSQINKSKQIKGYANGTIAYGPTLGLFGEYPGARHDPEVVAPLSKLSSILRQQNIGTGGAQVFIPDMRISGQDLLVIFKRANKSFDR